MQLKSTNWSIIIFILLISTSCIDQKDEKTTYFKKFLNNQLNEELKNEADYLIITYMGCTGCVQKGITNIISNPKYALRFEKIIYSNTALNRFNSLEKLEANGILDSSDKIEYLNIGISGFSIISVHNGEISSVKNLTVKDFETKTGFHNFITK